MAGTPVPELAGSPYPASMVEVTLNPAKAKLVVAKAVDQYVDVVETGVAVTMVVHASEVDWMKKAGIIL